VEVKSKFAAMASRWLVVAALEIKSPMVVCPNNKADQKRAKKVIEYFMKKG
jgi:hypothetical protein